MRVTGLVLAAGGSTRLGQPKQLLPHRGRPLLAGALDVARDAGFDQLVVALGAAADDVAAAVDLQGADVVRNDAHGTGCSSSIAAALPAVDPRSDGVVLLLGDQPGVRVDAVAALLRAVGGAALGVCRYDDGLGHPFWLGRAVFDDLSRLHGDKGVWKLIESGRHPVAEARIGGTVPLDVDTWDDYERLVAADAAEGEVAR